MISRALGLMIAAWESDPQWLDPGHSLKLNSALDALAAPGCTVVQRMLVGRLLESG